MKRAYYIYIILFFVLAAGAATRTSKYDQFIGGTFTGTTVTGTTSVDGGNLQLSGNSLISTDTDGNITLDPNGTGESVVEGTLLVGDSDGDSAHTIGGASIQSALEVHTDGGASVGGLSTHRLADSATLGGHIVNYKGRGSTASPAVVQAGDTVSRYVAAGFDGTDYELLSEIRMSVDGTPGNDDMPGKIGLYTTIDGSTSPTLTMEIHADQTVGFPNGGPLKPALNFLNDSDNGMYYIGSDNWGFSAGGVKAMGFKISTSSLGNVGIGGSASTSDNYPLLMERSRDAALNVQLSNPSTNAAAAAQFELKADNSANTGTLALWANSAVDAYGKNLVMRSTDSSTGISLVSDGASPESVKIYSGGVAAINKIGSFNATGFQLHSQLAMKYEDSTGGEYISFQAPSTVTSSTAFILPDGDGTADQILATNGSGTLQWADDGGGGGGVKSYLDEAMANLEANSTTDFSTYDDTGAYVDGTGGSPATISIASTNTSGELLGKTYSLKITKAATDGSGEGVTILTRTIEPEDYGRILWGELEVDFTDANYTSGDVSVHAYDVTNSKILAVVASVEDDSSLPNRKGKFQFYVITDGTSGSETASIRISLHLASDSDTGNAWSAFVDDYKLGPQSSQPGYFGTEPESFIPNFTNFTLGNGTITQANHWRDGSFMKGRVRITLGSTSAMGTTPQFTVPSGESMDTNFVTADNLSELGTGTILDATSAFHKATLFAVSASEIGIRHLDASTLANGITSGLPMTWTTNDAFDIHFKIPIDGWKASNLVSTQELMVSTAVASVESLVTPTGTVSTTYTTAVFGTLDTNDFDLYNTTTGVWTAPRTGHIQASAALWYIFTSGSNKTGRVRIINTTTGNHVLADERIVGAAVSGQVRATGIIKVNKGDAVEIQSYHDGTSPSFASGGSQFSLHFINDFSVYGAMATGSPTIQKFTSGSGTYTTPNNVRYIKVRMVGAGGGGAGSGTASGGAGGSGGTSVFGTSLLTANGGVGATAPAGGVGAGGVGGTATVASPSIGFAKHGGRGEYGPYNSTGSPYLAGGSGGETPFGGAGTSANTGAGFVAEANTGSGGGGGGTSSTVNSTGGGGGGASGYVDAIINNPDATYSYTVGAAGTAGSAGTSGFVGGAGAAGFIIVEEYY